MSAPIQNDGQPALEKQRLRVWLRLLKVSRTIESELRERLRREYSSTLPRFDVLSALQRAPQGLKMSQLSSVLMVSNGNVTGIIDRHVKDNLVVRVPVGGDKRAMMVKLTEQGERHFSEMATSHSQWLNELMQDVGAEDAAVLLQLLGNIDSQSGA
ncbi:MAG: MarR family transcriptional regulator [Pseudomonadales bacterium]|nr:MarR family transcriptional regulator [Pseudomonadales bacterium]